MTEADFFESEAGWDRDLPKFPGFTEPLEGFKYLNNIDYDETKKLENAGFEIACAMKAVYVSAVAPDTRKFILKHLHKGATRTSLFEAAKNLLDNNTDMTAELYEVLEFLEDKGKEIKGGNDVTNLGEQFLERFKTLYDQTKHIDVTVSMDETTGGVSKTFSKNDISSLNDASYSECTGQVETLSVLGLTPPHRHTLRNLRSRL